MPHLLIAGKMHPAGLALLKDVDGVTYDYVEEVSEPSYAPLIGKADGLVIRTQPLSAATIAEARQLKIVSRHGVGYDAVDVAALNNRWIPLCIVGDVNSHSVAEHVMLLVLACAKSLTRARCALVHGSGETGLRPPTYPANDCSSSVTAVSDATWRAWRRGSEWESVRSIRSSLRMVGLKELSTRPLRWRMDLPGQTSFRSTCRRPLDRFWALRNLRS